MPNKIVLRANEILHFLEKEKHKNESQVADGRQGKKFDALPKAQMALFEADPKTKELQNMLDKIDINTISPVEALLKLNEILGIYKKWFFSSF